MISGLTSLQAALAIFHPGALLDAVNSYSQRPVRFSCDKHVHVVPSGRICGNPAKFGASAVNVNTDDDITKEQIHGLRSHLGLPRSLGRPRRTSDWIQIPLKEGAVIESRCRYRLSKPDEAVIDEVFDKARQDGRMSAVEGLEAAGWPVFVVWKNGKARPSVDL